MYTNGVESIACYNPDRKTITVIVDLVGKQKIKFSSSRSIFNFLILAATLLVSYYFLSYIWVIVVFTATSLILELLGTDFAPWHGAEHKALDAYERTRKCNLATARKASPISEDCGTRFMAARHIFNFTLFAVCLILHFAGVGQVVTLIFPLGLLVSPIVSRYPFFAQSSLVWFFSKRFQKWFFVREPNEDQLLTAHYALSELLRALGLLHKRSSDAPVDLPRKKVIQLSNKEAIRS